MRATRGNNIYSMLQQQRMQRTTSQSGMQQGGRAERHFARLDTSGDGKLDDTELQKIAQHLSQQTGQNISVADIKARVDSDGDGSISLDEMKSALPPPPGGRRGRLEADFAQLDASGDGELDDTELGQLAQHLSQQTGQSISVDDLKAAMDSDGSGTVSLDEVRQALPPPPPPPGAMGGPQGLPQDAFDASGALSSDVISTMAQELSQATGTTVSADELSSAMDTNGDGSVDRAEVQNLMMQARMMRM